MIPAFVLKIVIFAVALVFLVLVVRSLFVRRAPGTSRNERIRLPRSVAIVAAVALALGLVVGMLGFGSGNMRDPVPFRIASVVLLVVGLLAVLVYRNWYIAPGVDAVVFRTVFGIEKVIRYRDIVSHRVIERRGKRMLVVRSSTGTTLRVNTSAHHLPAVLAAAEARST